MIYPLRSHQMTPCDQLGPLGQALANGGLSGRWVWLAKQRKQK